MNGDSMETAEVERVSVEGVRMEGVKMEGVRAEGEESGLDSGRQSKQKMKWRDSQQELAHSHKTQERFYGLYSYSSSFLISLSVIRQEEEKLE